MTFRSLSMTLLVSTLSASFVMASTMTRPMIIQAVVDLESCMRTMCLPANDASMAIGGGNALRGKLAQQPNALDQWTIARLDPIVALLKQKKIQLALDQTQATLGALVRPQVLGALQGLEVCVRTMCLPANEPSMGIGGAQGIIKDVAKYQGPFGRWVTQRLNAIVLLLQQKKIREGLAQIQATIAELPQP